MLVYGDTQIDIISARIINYLLEKSRIVSISEGERNYHIFYYFCKGTTPQEKLKFKLADPINKYYYLNQSSVYDLPKRNDEAMFHEIRKEFMIYLTEEETHSIFQVLSIILNIGNTIFHRSENKNN
jgi:myosin heavy subunit